MNEIKYGLKAGVKDSYNDNKIKSSDNLKLNNQKRNSKYNKKLRTKILLLFNIILISSLAILTVINIISVKINCDKQIDEFRSDAIKMKQDKLKSVIDIAFSFFEKNETETAIYLIKNIRYDGDNYIWINDLEPKMIMHPNYPIDKKPEWYKKNGLSDYKDKKGKLLFVEFVKACKANKEGFVDYYWTKPGLEDNETFPKLSYVKLNEKLGWIVGTGIYMDDIDKIVDEKKAMEVEQINNSIIVAIILTLIILIISIIILIFITNTITNPIIRLANFANNIMLGDNENHIDINRQDEIGILVEAMNKLVDTQRDIEKFAISIKEGDFSQNLSVRSEKDNLIPALNSVVNILNDFKSEISELIKKSIAGKLHERGDVNRFHKEYAEIIKSTNLLIDTLVGLIDKMPVVVLTMDKELNILYMNKMAYKLTESTPDMVKGKKCRDIIKADDCISGRCACHKAMTSGNVEKAETKIKPISKDYEIEYSGIPIKDEKGHIVAVVEFAIDQTDIKKANNKFIKISQYQKQEIEKLSNCLFELAKGDLTVEYIISQADDDLEDIQYSFVSISIALSESLNSLNKLISQVNNAATQIAQASSEVAGNSQVLASGASEQAATLEEVNATVTEISSVVNINTKSAIDADAIAKQSNNYAIEGNKLMNEMLSAMNEINDSSNSISKIIKVIEEIAFQTNILSLNAAVEAARAGKHGRGFSVVADEVRNLAQRSATAAKETTSMIENSIQKVTDGFNLSNQTAYSLNKIVESVTKVNELINNIAKSSEEQSHAINEFTSAFAQIENVTQSTAAAAEESASSSEELTSMADELKAMIKQFKIKH